MTGFCIAAVQFGSFRISWMELLMLGMGVLLTLGLLVFFVLVIVRSRDQS